jgi:hypothetical protein
LPQSVISEHITIIPEIPHKTGHSGVNQGETKL